MGIPNVTYLKLGHLFLPPNLAFLPSLTSKLMAMPFFCGSGQKPCNHTNHSLSRILPIKTVSKTHCLYFQNRPRVQALLGLNHISVTIITSCLNYCRGLPSGLLTLVLVPVSLFVYAAHPHRQLFPSLPFRSRHKQCSLSQKDRLGPSSAYIIL